MTDLASEFGSRLLVRVVDETLTAGRYDFSVGIGVPRPFHREISLNDVERWSDQSAKIAAAEIRETLRAESTIERRPVASLVVAAAVHLHATLRLKSKP